jgi:23S rRNA (guanosine2251-2'-O)-methyltransferase
MPTEMLYGRQPAAECLRAGRREIRRLLIARTVRDNAAIAALLKEAAARGVTVAAVEPKILDELTGTTQNQGVAVEAGGYPYAALDAALDAVGGDPLALILDHVQDPQNLGALLRTAEAAGVSAVVIPKDRAAEVTPTVVRASAGAAEHVAVCRVVNLHQTLRDLKARRIWIAGLADAPDARLFTAADLRGPLGLVVGSEGEGLTRLVRETCDFLIRLPMRGRVGSLNASVAGAIALYEILRQRG